MATALSAAPGKPVAGERRPYTVFTFCQAIQRRLDTSALSVLAKPPSALITWHVHQNRAEPLHGGRCADHGCVRTSRRLGPDHELNRGACSYDLANCAADARDLRLPRLRPHQTREVLTR
jgi:hypothetical protein